MTVTPATGLPAKTPSHSRHVLAFVPISWVKSSRWYMARVAWKKAHKPTGPTIGRLTTEASKTASDANARENSSSVGRRTISIHVSPGGGCSSWMASDMEYSFLCSADWREDIGQGLLPDQRNLQIGGAVLLGIEAAAVDIAGAPEQQVASEV